MTKFRLVCLFVLLATASVGSAQETMKKGDKAWKPS